MKKSMISNFLSSMMKIREADKKVRTARDEG
jgi:hypothetical protein